MNPGLSILLGVTAVCGGLTSSARTNQRPNVLFLFADDQRADALGCSGNSFIRTPNIDQLAKNGVRFRNGYVMGGHHGAICAPSRAMLMSGKSLFHVYDKLEGVETMPAYFAKNGYMTFGTGKWHNEKSAFESSFQMAKNVFLGGMSDHFKVPCYDMGVDGKLAASETKGFSTDIFAGAAKDFLLEYAGGKREQPFFCYVAFTAPHDPRSPRTDYIGLYPDESIPLPGNFKKLHPFAFDDLTVRDENLAPWPRTPEIIQSSLADYYALISHLDSEIGGLVKSLKECGLYENTLIIYAADNGLAIGSHGLMGKQSLYEHSTKVPIILSGPGIPKEMVADGLVYLYDLFPTICNLCRLPAPSGIDGRDLSPVIKGDIEGVRNVLYTAYRSSIRAVRTNEWKLIRYPKRNFTQLFNLKSDPLEISNLAAKPEYAEKVNEMMNLLMEGYFASGDTATMNPLTFLPLEYDYRILEQKPDQWQPDYTLKRYFKEFVKKGN